MEAVPLRQRHRGWRRRGLCQLPDGRRTLRGVRGRAHRRKKGGAAELRGRPLLRGLLARRSHGVSRASDAFVRPDEAGRPGGSEYGASTVRRGPASPRGRGRVRVQLGRFPNATDLGRAVARLSDHRRTRGSGRSFGSAPFIETRSSTRRVSSTSACSFAPDRVSSWPDRSPASKGTSRAAHAASFAPSCFRSRSPVVARRRLRLPRRSGAS